MTSVPKKIKKLELDLSQITRTKSIFNQNQIQKLWNSTNARYKYQRPAKGGGSWTYVKVSYVRKVLDSVFGFDWDFDIDTSVEEAFGVAKLTGGIVLKGTLFCRVVDDAGRIRTIKKTQFGRADVKWKRGYTPEDVEASGKLPRPLDIGNDFKAATSDCLKKCASLVGIAADVYEAEEFMEITITGSDEDKASGAKRQASKLKKAVNKRVVNKESEKVGKQNEGK